MARVQTMKERLNFEGYINLPLEISTRFTLEVEQQTRIGNKASLILIDGKAGQQVQTVQRRARAFFTRVDPKRLAAAAHMAWDLLVAQTRVLTGRARASYALYLRSRPVGGQESIDRAASLMTERDLMLIVGPGVAYGRKLYWRPAGRQREVKRTRTARVRVKQGGTMRLKVRTSYVEPAFRAIKRLLRRRFPDLYIDDGWRELRHGSGPQGERWPALAIGMRVDRSQVH
jgi:hypothetical protein